MFENSQQDMLNNQEIRKSNRTKLANTLYSTSLFSYDNITVNKNKQTKKPQEMYKINKKDLGKVTEINNIEIKEIVKEKNFDKNSQKNIQPSTSIQKSSEIDDVQEEVKVNKMKEPSFVEFQNQNSDSQEENEWIEFQQFKQWKKQASKQQRKQVQSIQLREENDEEESIENDDNIINKQNDSEISSQVQVADDFLKEFDQIKKKKYQEKVQKYGKNLCPVCDEGFLTFDELKTHVYDGHPPTAYKLGYANYLCEKCMKKCFMKKRFYKNHKNACNNSGEEISIPNQRKIKYLTNQLPDSKIK